MKKKLIHYRWNTTHHPNPPNSQCSQLHPIIVAYHWGSDFGVLCLLSIRSSPFESSKQKTCYCFPISCRDWLMMSYTSYHTRCFLSGIRAVWVDGLNEIEMRKFYSHHYSSLTHLFYSLYSFALQTDRQGGSQAVSQHLPPSFCGVTTISHHYWQFIVFIHGIGR